MTTPELTVLVLAGGDLQNKRLGPAPPQHHHPMLLPAGSGLAVDAILRFYRQSPRAIELKVWWTSHHPWPCHCGITKRWGLKRSPHNRRSWER